MGNPLSRPRLLLVDDSRLDRELALEALRDLADVTSCGSAEEALERLAGEPYDVLLSDLSLPGLSGIELIERVAREGPPVDALLLTAHASLETAVRALRVGAVDYLSKPVRAEDLRVAVARIVERRQLRAENTHLRELLSAVEDCRALSGSLEAAEIHGFALDILLSRLGRDRGVALFHRGPAASDDLATRGYGEAEEARLRVALLGEKPVDIDGCTHPELASTGELHDALCADASHGSRLLVVPVRGRESEGGLLAVPEGLQPFSVRELEIARIVATHAQVAVQNAERYHAAQERAFLDDVTGIYNARYLFTALEHELRRADRYGSELSLLFLDVDRFKLVNDRHGHLVGSRTLRRLAEVLGQCTRQVDTLARYGGDEFTVLLADTGLESGLVIGERIRASIAAAVFEARSGAPLQITVSVGVSSFPDHGRTPEALIDVADKAMYRAKSLGRNRVCSASEL